MFILVPILRSSFSFVIFCFFLVIIIFVALLGPMPGIRIRSS